MSTIDDPLLIVKVIKHNGDCNFDEGPEVIAKAIFEYESDFDTICYKIIYSETQLQEFVGFYLAKTGKLPAVIYIDGKITSFGREFLAKHSYVN